MTMRLGGAALAGLMLAACAAAPAPMGSAEPSSRARQGIYDCSPNASGTRQVIAENADDAERLCNSPAGR
jgi:hypothetical protein